MAYAASRTYILTPGRKRLGKAVARNSKQALAKECLKQPGTKEYILRGIGALIRNEMKSMCSDRVNSLLRSTDIKDLHEFTWDQLLTELRENAPIFLRVLNAAIETRLPRRNTSGVVGVCAAILLKHRFSKMCLGQKILSLILYAGHSSKQVYRVALV